jgi:hypothetical protein
MTKPKPRLGRLPGLHMGALRLLLGAEPIGGVKHGSIVRYRHLIAHCYSEADWEAHKKALQKEFGPLVREHRRLCRQRRLEAKSRAAGRRKAEAKTL